MARQPFTRHQLEVARLSAMSVTELGEYVAQARAILHVKKRLASPPRPKKMVTRVQRERFPLNAALAGNSPE